MNKILIDSHVFLWILYDDSYIGQEARQNLDRAERVFVSQVSLWELAIKYSKNKLPYSPDELLRSLQTLGPEMLPLRNEHILTVPKIVLPQGDPFDRMLAAQSKTEDLVLMTADKHFLKSSYLTLSAIE